MVNLHKTFLALSVAAFSAIQAQAAVKITALQMISTDANGKIQGVGAHRFKTTNHGGQPCLYVVEGEDLNGPIVNGPGPTQNGVNLNLSVGTHTYTSMRKTPILIAGTTTRSTCISITRTRRKYPCSLR